MTDEVRATVADRLRRSRGMLSDADLLLEAGSARSSVNRAYYAVFHAARALLASVGFEATKHAGVLTEFDRRFVKTGSFAPSYSKALHGLFDLRTDADYRDFVEVPLEEAADLLAGARDFVAAVQLTLAQGGWLDADPDPQSGSDTNG